MNGLAGIEARQIDLADGHILHDAALAPAPGPEFFDAAHWRSRDAVVDEARGRGAVCVFRCSGRLFVLRHYHRGGWVANLSRDRYWWAGLDNTRAWREFRLLADLYGLGLPVPRPVAARVLRRRLRYSADLVTAYIPDTMPLADRLARDSLPAETWRGIGEVVSRFHAHGVYHADLNARNILLGPAGAVYLVDFDKGHRADPDPRLMLGNLERLQRSLHKLLRGEPNLHFRSVDWSELLSGYRDGAGIA